MAHNIYATRICAEQHTNIFNVNLVLDESFLNYKLNDVSLLSKMTFMTILIDATYFLLFRRNCRAQMR
jgi:hypothetical protein